MRLPNDYQSDEFLHFLAEVLDSGTGMPRLERLSTALRLTRGQEAALAEALITDDRVEVLALIDLLEAVYDQLGSMSAAVAWLNGHTLPAFDNRTPFQVCLSGELEPLRRSQRRLRKCRSEAQDRGAG